MPSFRLELFKGKALKDDRFPICITVTHKGKVKRKSIASATLEQWDSKSFKIKPKGRRDFNEVNSDIDCLYDKYKAVYKELISSGRNWSCEDVFKEHIKKSPMFIENSESYISTITKVFTKDGFKVKHDKILRYTKGNDFSLENINERWLTGFRLHCRTKEKSNKGKNTLGNSENTINQAIKYLKMVCNYAEVDNKALKKTKLSFKEPLLNYPTIEDFKKLQTVKLTPGTNRWHVLNIFSIQLYFRGMRIGDALQLEWSDIKDGRLEYDTSKTGHSHSIEIPPVAMDILNFYKGSENYIFPFFNWRYDNSLTKEENDKNKNVQIKRATSVVNNNLKKLSNNIGITRNISTHQARHMFAIWADELLKGDLGMVQKLLGHKDRAMTERYIKRLRHTADLDEAANVVLSGIG